ncbi:HlyD family efflux transporter periplasmic adaptor subunit [Lachnospiraceae bacterium OttesenSCG-928-D06]|nr:HlyD family efflux transporter periplasmic adaptor subunit [Lachnospiraceae bacterium OttesenSCG-928-D06]
MADKMKVTTQKSKKYKVMMIAGALVVVLAGGLVFINGQTSMAANRAEMMENQMEMDEVTIRSLIKSVGATGTIVSINGRELTTTLSNVAIQEIHVEIGDFVSKGSKLISFDTSDIEADLESAQKSLSTSEQKNALSVQDAARNVKDSLRTKEYQTTSAKAKLDAAYTDYINSRDDYNKANDKLNTFRNNENSAYNAYQEALQELEEVAGKQDTVSDSNGASVEEEYKAAKIKCESAETFYEAKKAEREGQSTVTENAASKYNTAYLNYQSAVRDYENVEASQESSVASAKSSEKSSNLNVNTDTEKTKVKQYEQQLEKGILTAPFDGIITAINYEENDLYNGGGIITIQDCSAYEIEAQISEYDISDIALSQKVLIKTNATGNEELEGEVIFISPTATTKAAGQEITYSVRIAILSQNDRLRLDMSASLSIIIESHNQVYTVPYNAVKTDEAGNSFITEVEIKEGETKTKDIPVTVKMESNYYTEIEGEEIYEGQRVQVISVKEEPEEDTQSFRGGF